MKMFEMKNERERERERMINNIGSIKKKSLTNICVHFNGLFMQLRQQTFGDSLSVYESK